MTSKSKVQAITNLATSLVSKELNDGSIEEDYIYRGIAGRQFRQTFALADHVKVNGSELRDGILTIELERDLPEEKKPRLIQIS